MWFRKEDKQPQDKKLDLDILKKVRKIHIQSRRMVNDVMAGEYQSAFKGRGMEFDTVREFADGDDPRQIDWNVTARMGHPFVKSFIEERELTVIFLVDISASGQFGTRLRQKKEVIAELCAVLSLNAMKKNDRVGLVLFSDKIELYVPPKKGRNHTLRVIRELLLFSPRHKKTSLKVGLNFITNIIRKKSVVFLVSDFLDENYFQSLSLANKRHDVVAVEVYDKAESEMSSLGLIEVEDLETGERQMIDTSSKGWRSDYEKLRQFFDEEKRRYFRKYKVDHLRLRSDRSFEHELSLFFHSRNLKRK
ncbi:MAG: DUF58 domain-containing protein [Deltaproteobacteria bacterium]|nr:DUF58 domain-containing protein [Deltaproteobacteria bacterium]